jgi:hypothetical protein
MHPRVDLQVTDVRRCKPQLNSTIGADVSGLCVTGRIFDGYLKEPLAEWSLTYLASIFH